MTTRTLDGFIKVTRFFPGKTISSTDLTECFIKKDNISVITFIQFGIEIKTICGEEIRVFINEYCNDKDRDEWLDSNNF